MGVLLILSAWVVTGVALCGVGLLATRVLGLRTDGSLSLSFWMGLAATLGALCVLCLVHAVDGAATLLFFATAATGFAACRDERRLWWRRFRKNFGWMLAMVPIAIWMADRARIEPQNGDSYLYHLHALAWAESYRATPGLGNLHDRLGFNDSSTLFLALLDHGPLANRAIHVANGLLLLPLFGRGLRSVVRLVRQRATPRDGLDAVLLAPAVDWALGMNLSSASPDLPVACMQAAIASELAGCVALTTPLPVLVLLGAGLLTVKLSALGFVLGLGIAIALLARPAGGGASWWRTGIVAVVLLGAWVTRGILLSGYPFYPSPLGALPVDWRVPLERAREEYGYMMAWGRNPGQPWREVLASWDWLGPWFKSLCKNPRDAVIPVVGTVALLLVAVLIPGRKPGATRTLFLLFVPPVVALALWFATSPDVRFAGACFWLLPAAGAAVLAARDIRGVAALALPGVVLVLAVWPFNTPYSVVGPRTPEIRDPPPTRTRPFVTRSGLQLVVPTSGSGCWGSALLCAAKPNPDIRLRDPDNIAVGFSVQP